MLLFLVHKLQEEGGRDMQQLLIDPAPYQVPGMLYLALIITATLLIAEPRVKGETRAHHRTTDSLYWC